MKYHTIIFIPLFILSACALTHENTLPQMNELTRFFTVCETDIKKAVEVVRKHKIAEILNHFLIVSGGGKKYYLLEKENISEMILAVTEGTYSDLILLNNKGTVIYAMKNDDIFGKTLKHEFEGTSLDKCFLYSSKGLLHIEDVSVFPPLTENKCLLVSYPDFSDGYLNGIFVIQINHDIIKNIFPGNIQIISNDGLYRISDAGEKILTPYPYMININTEGIGNGQRKNFLCGDKICTIYRFKYSSLEWSVIKPSE